MVLSYYLIVNSSSLHQNKNRLSPLHKRKIGMTRYAVRVMGLFILALTLMTTTMFTTMTWQLQAGVKQHDLSTYLSAKRAKQVVPIDKKAGQPLNILIIGSDSRAGTENAGKVAGMRSDTTMLAHISANRKRIEIVSIPRDTLLPIPACKLPNGKSTWAQDEMMFNAAFALGGATGDINAAASCTLNTVEKLTGVLIDGYIVLNFNSFEHVVNTIGGVEICFKEDVYDRESGLNVKKGCQLLDGKQALAFARTRHALGNGSDISRISRQQELVGTIAEKIISMNVVSNAPKLYSLLKNTVRYVDTSQGLGNINWLGGFAYSLKGLKLDDITFITMPHYPEGNRVRPARSAEIIWDALREDKPIPPSAIPEKGEQKEVVLRTTKPKTTNEEPAPAE